MLWMPIWTEGPCAARIDRGEELIVNNRLMVFDSPNKPDDITETLRMYRVLTYSRLEYDSRGVAFVWGPCRIEPA